MFLPCLHISSNIFAIFMLILLIVYMFEDLQCVRCLQLYMLDVYFLYFLFCFLVFTVHPPQMSYRQVSLWRTDFLSQCIKNIHPLIIQMYCAVDLNDSREQDLSFQWIILRVSQPRPAAASTPHEVTLSLWELEMWPCHILLLLLV